LNNSGLHKATEWLYLPAKSFNEPVHSLALARQAVLTKPPGSLGQLESVATHIAGLQGQVLPKIDRIMIRVFAGDHGVVEQGVSAFPQAVTAEMVKNFSAGGAAITVLAASLDADFSVINLGTVAELAALPGVEDKRIAPGTANFCKAPAMSHEQLEKALFAGKQAGIMAREKNTDLFIGGEMGIGNTCSASAIACAILDQPAAMLVGKGTGVDAAGIQRKQQAVTDALALHCATELAPIDVLRCLGGFEIAGLVGAYIACAQQGVVILLDGFISTVAALLACKLNPSIRPWLMFSHCSEEEGHQYVLAALKAQPLLNLGMRLGEASGAAIAAPLLKTACQLHELMATFQQAGVSEQ
jgi:nicotinate-nucleotide--dimethylbenzimidazole phosphoribosyltransferase